MLLRGGFQYCGLWIKAYLSFYNMIEVLGIILFLMVLLSVVAPFKRGNATSFILPVDSMSRRFAMLQNTSSFKSMFVRASVLTKVVGAVFASSLLTVVAEAADPIFLYPFFDGNGQNGVYLSWSEDGRNFHLLNDAEPIFTPPSWDGQNLTRDPSVIYQDGVFHMVWTSNWTGRIFGYASSTDLKHWSTPQQVLPYPAELDDIDQPNNIWAPEIFFDPVAANFRIVWASTIPREYQDGDGSTVGIYDNRQWSTTTTDFTTFTPAELYYDNDVDVIDAMSIFDADNEQWFMVIATDAYIRSVTHAPTLTGASGWSAESDAIVGAGTAINGGKRGEGPSVVKNGDEWLLYWDSTWDNDWGMASSPDLVNWTDLTSQFHLYFKNGSEYIHPRHGSVIQVPRSVLAGFDEIPQAYATPRAHLMFNETAGETAADVTGHGWDGTLVNGPTHVSGQGDNGVALDGTDDYVSLPTGVVAPLGDFTIATWVYLDSVANWARIFDFGTGTTSNMFLTPKNGANDFVRFGITTTGGSGEDQIDGTATLPTGVWTHVAVTLEGPVGILYVNGVEVGRNEAMSLTPHSLGFTTQNWIGRSQYNDPYLDGQVDDFRIYSGALNASEIQALADGTARALLSPWTSQDVGGPTLAGSAGCADADVSTVYLTAAGSDIWSTGDQFHYAWQSWTGDGTFIARVDSLAATDASAKAGIMFRESLDADARNCLVAITPSNGCTFQSRSTAGGATTSEVTSAVAAPVWIKLVREGDTFTPYYSADGTIWTQAASAVTLPVPSTAYVGLALTAHTNSDLTAAEFDNVAIIDAVLHSSLDHWRYDGWGTTANTGDAADDADPDADGRSNLFEYGVGSDPFSPDSAKVGSVAVAEGQATCEITFNRIADPDLTYTVFGTDDLTADPWSTLWSSTGASNVAGPVTVEHSLGTDEYPKYFLRLSVSY